MSIAIIDFGLGNLTSLYRACRYLGLNAYITSNKNEIQKSEKIILSGLGSYKDAISLINNNGLDTVIKQHIKQGKYLLGICLGHQLLFKRSIHERAYKGLSLLKGEVKKINNPLRKKSPVGWKSISTKPVPIFRDFNNSQYMYFFDKYHIKCPERFVIAHFEYCGNRFATAVQKKNIIGIQFLPEKSGNAGLKILKSFGEL